MHAFNPSTWEAEAGDLCEFEFQKRIQSYRETLSWGEKKEGRKEERKEERTEERKEGKSDHMYIYEP